LAIRAAGSEEEKRTMRGDLKNWRTLSGSKGFEAGFTFLERNDLATLPLGRHDIDGDSVYVLLQRSMTRSPAEGRFESHHRYIDIQFLIAGEEMIGLAPVERLNVTAPYDDAKDITFYAVAKGFEEVSLEPGQFAVFFPADGHMPLCAAGQPMEIHKAVVKVKLDFWSTLQE
jgi:biofilm protein TabA